jgi:hypothetical protein
MNGIIAQDSWYPVLLTNSTDFKTPVTGKVYGDIVCKYFKTGDSSQTAFAVTADNWKEAGEGKYAIRIGAAEWTERAFYQVSISCAGCIIYNFPVDTQEYFTPAGANQVTITVEEADHTPIPDVSVLILNSGQSITLQSATTDASGQVVVALNDGTYKVRLSKAMVNFTTPETLVVSGATSEEFTGTLVSPTAPSTGLQTVYIVPTDLGLEYSPTMVFWAVASRLNTVVDTAVLSNQILQAEDKTTHFEMQIAKGAVVTITGQNGSSTFFKEEITIDTNDTKNLVDYL